MIVLQGIIVQVGQKICIQMTWLLMEEQFVQLEAIVQPDPQLLLNALLEHI